MNDTSQALRRTMKAIVDASPEPPDLEAGTVIVPFDADDASIRRRPTFSMALAATALVVVALVGLVAVVVPSLDRGFATPADVTTEPGWIVVAFVDGDLDRPFDSVVEELLARPEVTDHVILDKSQAFQEALRLFADNEAMVTVLRDNPTLIPASIRVRTENKADAEAVADFASDLKDVDATHLGYGQLRDLEPWDLSPFEETEGLVSESDESPIETTTTLPADHPENLLSVMDEAIVDLEPPSGLVLLSNEMTTTPTGTVAAHVGENAVFVILEYASGDGSASTSMTVVISVNTLWDPEESISNGGGEMSFVTIPIIGDALVAETELMTTTIWPLPDEVTVSVIGRGVADEDLRAFTERLHTALLAARNN